MIYLSKAGQLMQHLRLVNSVAKNLTPDSVYTHLLIEQVDESVCQLIVNTGTCWLLRKVHAVGAIGTKFLVSSKDLERFCAKFPAAKKLRLTQRKGNLCTEALEEQETGEPIVSDTLMLRLYRGNLEDFQVPPKLEGHLFSLHPETAKQAFQILSNFGSYRTDKQPRAVLFILDRNILHIYANKQNGSNFYLKLSIPALRDPNPVEEADQNDSSEPQIFAISGKNLDYLANLSTAEPIRFTVQNSLFAEGDGGYSLIPLYDLDLASNVAVAVKLSEPNEKLMYCGERDVSLNRLIEALNIQEVDPKETTWREVKLEVQADGLLISKTHDLDRNEYSRVQVVTTSCLSTGWQVLSFNTEWLKAGLQAIKSTLKTSANDYIRIALEYADLNESKRWRVLIEPITPSNDIKILLIVVCQTIEDLEYLNEIED